jgi:hypothetical protein
MSETIETVKIKRDNEKGYRIINKSSFDPEQHELYEAAKAEGSGGPTRDEMKAFLAEKGIEFPANIRNDKLTELYEAAKAEG